MIFLPTLNRIAALTLYFAVASVYAQETNKSFTTTSNDCYGIKWSQNLLSRYPGIEHACQSVEFHDGVTYVKFVATVLKTSNGGRDLTLSLEDGGAITVRIPPETRLSINGKPTHPADLERGDTISFYIPQSRVVATFHPAGEPDNATPSVSAPLTSSGDAHKH